MKKLLSLLFMAFIPIVMMAYDVEINGIYYNLVNKNGSYSAIVTKGDNGYSGNIVIPSTINDNGITYSVSAIGEEAFSGCGGLTSIVIPDGVVSIGERAFYGCSNLTSIDIPEGVKKISNNTFAYCI